MNNTFNMINANFSNNYIMKYNIIDLSFVEILIIIMCTIPLIILTLVIIYFIVTRDVIRNHID